MGGASKQAGWGGVLGAGVGGVVVAQGWCRMGWGLGAGTKLPETPNPVHLTLSVCPSVRLLLQAFACYPVVLVPVGQPCGMRVASKGGPGSMSSQLGRRSACAHACGLSHTQLIHTNPLGVCRWETQLLAFPGAQPELDAADAAGD